MDNNKNYRNREQDRRLEWLEIRFATINEEMGSIKADVQWLKWWMRLMIGSQAAIILALLGLLFK